MATREPSVNLSPENEPFQVHVKTQDNQTHTYTVVPENSTVAALKEIISSDLQIPPAKQCLIFQGRLLRDNQTLKESKCLGQVVHLVKRSPNAPEPSTSANSTNQQEQQQQQQYLGFTFTHTPQVVFGSVPLSGNLLPNHLLQQVMQGVTQGLNQHLNPGVASAATNLNANASATNITTATGNGSTNNVNATSVNNSGAPNIAVTRNNQNLLVYQRLRYARRHLQRAQRTLDVYFSGLNNSTAAQEEAISDSNFNGYNEMTPDDYTQNIQPEDTLTAPPTSSTNTNYNSLGSSTDPEMANSSSAASTQHPPAHATLFADIQTQLADISLQMVDLLRQESDFLREDQPLEDQALVQQMERLCRVVNDVTACLTQAQENIIHLEVSPSQAPPRTISLRSRGVLQPVVQISINATAHPININANIDHTTNTNNSTQAPIRNNNDNNNNDNNNSITSNIINNNDSQNDINMEAFDYTTTRTPPHIPEEWQQVILLDQKNKAEYQESQNSLSNSYMKFADLEPICGSMISCTAVEVMCKTLKLAVKETNVEVTSSIEDMLNDLKQNSTLKKSYNKYIDSNLKKRLLSDHNYSGESFPNAEEYFKPNQ